MSVSDAVYESALARIDALERERDDWRDKTRSGIAAALIYQDERAAAVAEVERLRAAHGEIKHLIAHEYRLKDYSARFVINTIEQVVDAALAGGVGDTA